MSKAGCTLSHFSGVNASFPMSDTIPEGCQIHPVLLVLPEHSLCKPSCLKTCPQWRQYEDPWKKDHRKEDRGDHAGLLYQVEQDMGSPPRHIMFPGVGAAEISSTSNPPALCTHTTAHCALEFGHWTKERAKTELGTWGWRSVLQLLQEAGDHLTSQQVQELGIL